MNILLQLANGTAVHARFVINHSSSYGEEATATGIYCRAGHFLHHFQSQNIRLLILQRAEHPLEVIRHQSTAEEDHNALPFLFLLISALLGWPALT
jgi:hypothetical protein